MRIIYFFNEEKRYIFTWKTKKRLVNNYKAGKMIIILVIKIVLKIMFTHEFNQAFAYYTLIHFYSVFCKILFKWNYSIVFKKHWK